MFTNMRVRSSLARSLAPTMLPLLLLLGSANAEPPKTLQKPIDHCPSIGYFFERQDLDNYPGTCYLCYCNNDGQAVCTIRDSERCDHNESSIDRTDLRDWTDEKQNLGERTEKNKRRRSRRGLMELFFEDAKKDVMLKSMAQANEEDCQPKSSKSIGCPPKDWCTGCLVCDCGNNGEWQCHVMSFCEDKTPRPKTRKNKKIEINEIDTAETDEKKDTSVNTIPEKKNDKRSVKHKKNNNSTSTPGKKDKKVSKKIPKTKTSTTSTTTKKPQQPKIAVKTLKKFMRKDNMKHGPGVLVIKKYISTISPIDSPDLLKYKNDSQKLAQILYQQYEAATRTRRDSHAVKREIKLEKILNNKQKRHFELKYNARGRKPMNIKEHNDWNTKMRARKIERDHLKTTSNTNSFYSNQNELMSPDERKRIKKIQNDDKKHDIGSHRKKATVILIPRKRRNKRNVLPITDVPTNSTTMEKDTVKISVVNSDQIETLTSVLGINEKMTSDLNNYKYTVDNIITKKYDDETTSSAVVYESTLKYVDIITNDYHDLDTENVTAMGTPNYTNLEIETTTQQINYDLQSVDLNNYTINEMSTQDNQLDLENNHTFETTTPPTIPIDYSPDKNLSTDKEFIINYVNLETTTNTVIEENPEINNTDNKINNNTNTGENIIKKGYITDIDKIIKDLNKYTLEKWKNTNKTNVNMYTARPNTSTSRTFKSSTADFEKMLQSISHNKTINNSKQNRMIAIKYLKKLYSQLLSTKNNKSRLNNIAVMESICDTFGPCKISTNKMEVLNNKITELISETKKALNVIRSIKGILQLIDDETNSTDKHINDEVEFKSYVKKLNAVLTDTYKSSLTETEMTQMNFIKNNTKIFIHSIGKFAFILNEILEIIHSERIKYNNLRKRKILIKKVTRHKVSEPLHKIKNLFLKFNVLQSSFMRNMYQAISDLEKQNEQNALLYDKSVNYQRDTRYKKSVDKYMNKINYNLEKLKILALKMGAKGRKKRDLMDHDDAVDYLLTLMEYLLKHNNPVDSPPADGIDLLIDAIRRAPDIRPIKKKNLKQTSIMPTFPKVKSKTKTSSESEDDNSKNKSSKEDFKDSLSFEKQYFNSTQIVKPNNEEPNGYRKMSSDVSQKSTSVGITTSTTTKYVDVEDMVFNGDEVPKVYMATIPTYENIDDTDSEKEEAKPTIHKSSEIKTNESANNAEEETSNLTNRTFLNTDDKKENINTTETEKPIMTQFDRLNEEYEKQIKGKAPSSKNLKPKRKKNKRPRKKTKVDNKSDVSTITKEEDEEKIRKKVIVEEALLRKHIVTSTEDDPFQMDDESYSRDVTHLNTMHNEVFPSYFT
ncbi:protein PF3D7_1417600-like isoform X2 [Cydia pomonella]|uniref:protein PF3D7_1417600-like isoform X2 n=1 Tax=Cydia pomonella TaxID=82600 RepID=UPI002ADDAB77|nr:protein PF3D7_1417600-like isoform X2 [Cydia pomonella]